MSVYFMRWSCFIHLRIASSKFESPTTLAKLILSFADVKKDVRINNIYINNFSNMGDSFNFSNIEDYLVFRNKNYVLKFDCDTNVREKLCIWFVNKNKFKKFSYNGVDYEVIDMVWNDTYSLQI